tara:strand:+ start:150 stop:665 length:516 start_codon:yes stop_codon:yes gene_type:complete
MLKAVFFDRDGTLIKTFVKKNKPLAINNIKDLKLFNNAKFVIDRLSKNYKIFIITNQPDVARGLNSKKNVIEINSKLKKLLSLNKIYTSYSSNDENYFRKPNPGMILKAKKEFNLNLKKSYVIGDREKDIIAGAKAGCKTILIKKSYNNHKTIRSSYLITKLKDILRIIKV